VTQLVWYFDFVSPFSYLQLERYPALFASDDVELRPIVFAGLLDHWGHKGPAEIPGKRRFTYRQVQWLADSSGIALKFPPGHPFSPIKPLRLAIALGSRLAAVSEIFRFIWRDGRSPEREWRALAAHLGLSGAEPVDPAVKAALRRNGEQAIADGVFGVPTFRVGGELFWGLDATPMLLAYLDNPRLFDTAEMIRISSLPVESARGGGS
jgi:2-hydroxychromene-2-carboxylate isomerase